MKAIHVLLVYFSDTSLLLLQCFILLTFCFISYGPYHMFLIMELMISTDSFSHCNHKALFAPPMMFIRLPWTPGAISGAQRAVAGGNPTSWSQLDTVPLWNTWSWLILSQVLDLSILPTLNSSSSARTQMEIYQLLDPFNGRCWELKLGISTWKANVLVLNQSHLLFPGAQNSLHCFLPSKAPIIFANNLL